MHTLRQAAARPSFRSILRPIRAGAAALIACAVLAATPASAAGDPPCPPQSTVWVDDGYAGQTPGAQVPFPFGGSGTLHTIGCDAFATIQAAVDAVSSGGTVHVAAGTYLENVVINPPVTLLGANAGVDPRTVCNAATRGAETILDGGGVTAAIAVYDPSVTIDGFTIRGGGGTLNAGIWLGGVTGTQIKNNIITDNTIGVFPNGTSTLIQRNLFDGNNEVGPSGGTGIYIDTATSALTIDQNEFVNHTTSNPVIFAVTTAPDHVGLAFTNNSVHDNFSGVYVLSVDGGDFSGNDFSAADATGLMFHGACSDIVVANNFFHDSARGLRLQDDIGSSPNSNVQVHGNSFDASTLTDYAVGVPFAGGHTGTLDASGNWYDSNSAAVFTPKLNTAGGAIDYTPWLDAGTDTSGTGCNGFQGDFSKLHVDDDSPQAGPIGRIQEGVDRLANGALTGAARIVDVKAGTYAEFVEADVPVQVLGPHATTCPGSSLDRGGEALLMPGADAVLLNLDRPLVYVTSSGVSIKGMKLTGDNPSLTGQTVGAVTAEVDNLIANGAFDDDVTYPFIDVESVVVENNILVTANDVAINLYNSGIVGSISEDNRIACNRFDNLAGLNTQSFGGPYDRIAVLIYNDTYAVVDTNWMTAINIGVQTGNNFQANSGAAASISGNTIFSAGVAIWHNLHYAGASSFAIIDNDITSSAGAWGIWVTSILGAVPAVVSGNDVTGGEIGIAAWNNPTTSTITISGGTLSGCSLAGVNLTNFASFGPADPTRMNVSGVTTTGCASGVRVASETGGTDTARLDVSNVQLSGGTNGVLVTGALARATVINSPTSITGNVIGVAVDAGRSLIENNNLTGNTQAGIQAVNGAIVDAGDCSGANVTGLATGTGANGSSAGNNILSGYGFDHAAPWAVEDLNLDAQADVLAQNESFGASASQNVGAVVFDQADNAANSLVLYSQSGGQGFAAQPAGGSACVGSPFAFSVTANSATSYQWYQGATPIGGATSASYMIASVSAGDAGSYHVDITEACVGTTSSNTVVLAVQAPPTSSAGGPYSTCATDGPVAVSASASNSASGMWSTNGTGTFANAAMASTTYTPSAGDIAAGSRTLTWTADAIAPCATPATGNATLTIQAGPTSSAGGPYSMCSTSPTVSISASSSNSASGTWSTNGTGTFGNAASASTTYAPSAADITAGSRTLTWTANAITPCASPAVGDATLTIQSAPTSSAGGPYATCAGSGPVSIAASSSNSATGTWSSNGTGTFADAASASTTYTPSAADVTAGSRTLTWTADPVAPCASPAVGNATLLIQAMPTSNAGGPYTTCSTSGPVAVSASSSNSASGTWSSNGTGTFANAASASTTYTPSAGDITAGSLTLTWTANAIAPCASPAIGNATLTIQGAPTSSAGGPYSTCAGSGPVSISASSSNSASGTWSSNGTGTFGSASSASTTYTPSGADVTAGSRTLTWTANAIAPCASPAVGNATLTIQATPTSSAGGPYTMCSTSPTVSISANSSNSASGTWTTNGTGTFGNAASASTTYAPSAADITAGSRTLTWTADPIAPCASPAVSNATLTIQGAPTSNAGGPYSTCAGSGPVSISASSSNSASGTWSSNGTGTFANAAMPSTTYTPSAADVTAGSRTLTWTANAIVPCASPVASNVTLTIQGTPTSSAGGPYTTCSTAPFVAISASSSNSASGMWSTNGTGTFGNAAIASTTYAPSAADVAAGSRTLTWTAQPIAPCASPAVANATLTFQLAPTSNPGGPYTTCAGSGPVPISASSTGSTSGLWSTSGTGTFGSASSQTTSYTPSAGDIAAGSRTLTWTSSAILPCTSPVSAGTLLTIQGLPTSNAGGPYTTCSTSGAVPIAAMSTHSASGTWSSNGTGTFANAASASTTYTPSAGDVALGSRTLTWTANAIAPCASPVASNATLTIQPAPTSNAGGPYSTCSTAGAVPISASSSNSASGTWSSNGTGTFGNPSSANTTYTPSSGDIVIGSRILTWSANPIAPCASPALANATLTIQGAPTSSAGGPYSTCAGSGPVTIAAFAGSSSSGAWSTNGSGTFGNAASTNTTYTPSAADITAGSRTLTWTAQPIAPCASPAVGNATLTINPQPTWYADTDNDGFGDPNVSQQSCTQPPGFVADNTDLCPNDTNKQSPGQCGCGVADTDTDSDGVANCNDNCDFDFNPGQEDGDNDGVGNACDNCPTEPNPTQGDCDGDLIADACEIAAGEPDCNLNGIPDSCDLVAMTSFDANANTIPDECELDGGTPYCFGEVGCPCGNNSLPGAGQGCLNSTGQGASLVGSGQTQVSADTLVLSVTNLAGATGFCLFFQGTTAPNAVFGDGKRCVGGSQIRLKTAPILAFTSSFPIAGDPSVSVKGNVPVNGAVRNYQVWYRNADPGFCTIATFNFSNGVSVVWVP